MSYNICTDCYDAICKQLGVSEIEVYSTRAFPWSKCWRCGGQAFYLVPDRSLDRPTVPSTRTSE